VAILELVSVLVVLDVVGRRTETVSVVDEVMIGVGRRTETVSVVDEVMIGVELETETETVVVVDCAVVSVTEVATVVLETICDEVLGLYIRFEIRNEKYEAYIVSTEVELSACGLPETENAKSRVKGTVKMVDFIMI
jgi:hypothetical protein